MNVFERHRRALAANKLRNRRLRDERAKRRAETLRLARRDAAREAAR